MLLLFSSAAPTEVVGAAHMSIKVGMLARAAVEARVVGDAWVNVNVQTGVDTLLGGAEIGVVLSENTMGVVSPSETVNVQHQGATRLALRETFTNDGRPLPILTLPEDVQTCQMAFGVSAGAGTNAALAGAPVSIVFGWETGGESDAEGVVSHPEQLGLEFVVRGNEAVMVTIPPVGDWKTLRRTNSTDIEGDPEFFDLNRLLDDGDPTTDDGMINPFDRRW